MHKITVLDCLSPFVFTRCCLWWRILVQVCVQENAMLRQHLGVVSCLLYLLLFSHLFTTHRIGKRVDNHSRRWDIWNNMTSICYILLSNVIISNRDCFVISINFAKWENFKKYVYLLLYKVRDCKVFSWRTWSWELLNTNKSPNPFCLWSLAKSAEPDWTGLWCLLIHYKLIDLTANITWWSCKPEQLCNFTI